MKKCASSKRISYNFDDKADTISTMLFHFSYNTGLLHLRSSWMLKLGVAAFSKILLSLSSASFSYVTFEVNVDFAFTGLNINVWDFQLIYIKIWNKKMTEEEMP